LGSTVKVAVPLSTPQVTVIVYVPLPGAPGPFPTVNEPYTLRGGSLNTMAWAFVTGVPEIVQLVPSGATPPVAVTIITSPGLPEFAGAVGGEVRVTARSAACASLRGPRGGPTKTIETNSAEVSSSTTRNRELTLRVVNSKHATHVSVGPDYLMLDTRTDSGARTRCFVTHPPYGHSALKYTRIVFSVSTALRRFQNGLQ
jgi:hypothetical protein